MAFNMKWFLISPFTINVLNASILLVFMIFFLIKGKGKSRATLFLTAFLTGVTLVFISFVLIFSSVEPFYSTIAWLALHLFVFASVFMVQFAYYFPENLHPQESKVVLVVCTVASSIVYPYYVYKTFSMEPLYSFEGSLFVFFNTPEIGVVIGLEIIWVLFVFLRKVALLSEYQYSGFLSRRAGELGTSQAPKGLISAFARFCIACIKIFRARTRPANAIRNLFLIFVSPILLISAIVMAYQGFLSWEVVAHILGSGFMAVIFIFIMLYINNSSEPSTFLIKLIGISLGTILIIFGLVSNIALMIRDEEYDRKRLIEVKQCEKAVLDNDISQIPESVAYLLSRPLGEGPDSISNKVEFVRDSNFSLQKIIENKVENLPALKTGFIVGDMPEMTRLYRRIGRLNANDYYIHYDFSMDGRLYEVGYSYIAYRKVIHETGLKLVYIIMGSVLFIIVVFPLFFRESLVKPLNRLLDGVRKVNEGDLGVVVPVQVEDEIGFLSGSFNNMVKSILESEEKLKDNLDFQVKLTESYSYFVPKEFLEFLEKESIIDIKLGDNVQKEMSILFSDIRSFTMLSEKMSPQENFNFLNSCLSRIGPVVRNNGGFIDKYIGDAVMALFPGSAEDALHAAIAMQNVIRTYNKHRMSTGYEPIDIGVGIHTGILMLGTIGEERRMEGTVISDAVNLASRLEGLTKLYGASIIISDHTSNGLKNRADFHSRYLGRVQVKGKKKWVDIFEILDGMSSELVDIKLRTKKDFEQGILMYQNSEFAKACESFKKVLEENPEDGAASLYLKRCRSFERSGTPTGWEGVTAFDEK
jgi:class 3 adenylate cyclase/HAMP domain-containing protein